MPTAKQGERVGAILGSKPGGIIETFGEGVYEGDFVFGDGGPDDPVGSICEMVLGVPLEQRPKNPRIKLDRGGVVWGCECWWGPVDGYRKQIEAARKVVYVDINKVREDYRKEVADEAADD